MKKQLLLLWLMLIGVSLFAQDRQVTGTVTDSDGGAALPGVNVRIKGTNLGTATDAEGKFSINAPASATTLVFSYVGYTDQEVDISKVNAVSVSLVASSSELGEIVVAVGRGQERTITDTPLPIDNLTVKELNATGQPTFDKALQYKVPSFNSVNTPVNDATSLLDPYELRNMGPSRTLILINGKRKNLSSLVYTQTSPGRGETGADLSAIPQDAIKRVEILRDGASAQYGSDAIAGVMNIILKDKFDASSVRLTSGVTSKGDGFNYGLNYSSGANLGRKGYVNYHLTFLRQQRANRAGKIDKFAETNGDIGFGNGSNVTDFLNKYPDGKNINSTTDNTSAKFLINVGIPVSENTEVYFNAAYVYRKALSFANYRQPYWKLDYGLLHTPVTGGTDYTGTGDPLYEGYIGYHPTFEGDLNDYNGTIGIRGTSENGWKHDASLTVGGNKMLFTVNHTVNHSLGAISPISFKPGGFSFNHVVGNLDVSKSLNDKVYVGFGSEFRAETYKEIAGDTASYSGEGANSFPGFSSKNAITASRFNLGVYADFGFDLTENFFIGATGRTEKYSDFGNATVGKINTRLKLAGDKIVLRGSVSNGFRAPTLHQYNLTLNQASFEAGNIVIQGLANNYSREAAVLGIPKLKAEKSINFTAGLGLNPVKNLSITFDYYSIEIKNRIVYSALVKQVKDLNGDVIPDDPLNLLLADANSTGVSFFINGAHTKTQGLDLVASYKNLSLGQAKIGFNIAGNYVIKNELVGSIKTPEKIETAGGSIFSPIEQALMLTSRPKYKFIVGGELSIGKFDFTLNNTIAGPATFRNAGYGDFIMQDGAPDFAWNEHPDHVGHTVTNMLNHMKTVFSTRLLTDVAFNFNITSKTIVSLTVSNIFNQYPKYTMKALDAVGKAFMEDADFTRLMRGDLTFNGRYPYMTYDGAHINQLGTTFLGQVTFKF